MRIRKIPLRLKRFHLSLTRNKGLMRIKSVVATSDL